MLQLLKNTLSMKSVRSGKSCTSQLLNLTQYTFNQNAAVTVYLNQRGIITGADFVDLSAAYDTMNHRILIHKLYNTTYNSTLCRVFPEHAVQPRILCGADQRAKQMGKTEEGLPQHCCPTSRLTNNHSTMKRVTTSTQTMYGFFIHTTFT